MTRDEAARAFAEKMGWKIEGGGSGRPRIVAPATADRCGYYPLAETNGSPDPCGFRSIPAPDAPLHEKLAFTGRIAEAVFPNEDEVFRCGWVHGVLENCIEDARVKYDLCWVALLAALAALEAR